MSSLYRCSKELTTIVNGIDNVSRRQIDFVIQNVLNVIVPLGDENCRHFENFTTIHRALAKIHRWQDMLLCNVSNRLAE